MRPQQRNRQRVNCLGSEGVRFFEHLQRSALAEVAGSVVSTCGQPNLCQENNCQETQNSFFVVMLLYAFNDVILIDLFCSGSEAVNLIDGRLRQFFRFSSETWANCGDKRIVARTMESWGPLLVVDVLGLVALFAVSSAVTFIHFL